MFEAALEDVASNEMVAFPTFHSREESMRHVFVTGGSGFVGGAVIRRFLADGWRVRAMSRSATSDQKIGALGAEPVSCDLENVSAEHIADADVVVHAGAFVEPWGPKDAWDRINVRGTEHMLTTARAAGASWARVRPPHATTASRTVTRPASTVAAP